jgi:hypothetical protein
LQELSNSVWTNVFHVYANLKFYLYAFFVCIARSTRTIAHTGTINGLGLDENFKLLLYN